MGLANHTILVSKSGEEIAIDDSGAPIFAPDGRLTGIVLVFRDVTEQRKTQKATAELAAIVEYSGDAIATKNLDGIIQTWNDGAVRLFGYKREEIVGKPVTVLIPPDRLNEETEILQRIRKGQPSERLETIRVRKDGRPIHVSVCVSPIKDADGNVIGASKVVHDITALAAAREELVRGREFLATTISSIGDAVIATDAEGCVALMNRVAESLTGWTLDEACGKPLTEVFRIVNQETRQTVENPVDKVRRLKGVVGLANHTLLIAKSGREIAIDDSGAPIVTPDGTLAGIVLVFRDATEARNAEAKLTAQAALLDLAWDAIIVRDELGHIKFWNRGAEELYGWSRTEALGRTTHELIRTQFPVPLPDIVKQTRKDKRWQGELVHTTKSGRQVTVLSRWGLLPTKDGRGIPDLMETNTDITARKQDEAEIRKQREWLHTTLSSIGDAVIATDAQGLITLMNRTAEKLTGWEVKEAQGKPLVEVFRIVNQETRQTVEDPVNKVRRLNRVVGLANHTILIAKNGEEVAIDDSGAPIFDRDGKLAGIVLVFRNVTHQRQLEAALQSNEKLALAGRLSASIAHEIHNPLDTVGNVLFLLDQQVGDHSQARQLIEVAQREVRRVTEISKNMLSLQRESRTASKVKFSELLEGVVALVEETIAKGRRKIALISGFDGEVEAFPSELRQVFTNVIKNAVEATVDGGNIKIYSEAAQQSGQDGVLVRVVDDGVGIPEKLRPRLFSPFVTTKEQSGTGLGLWVSRSIVERHGGNIRLEGSAGKRSSGTTVAIFLPLKTISREGH